MDTASLLSAYETCSRAGFFRRSWERSRMSSVDMLYSGIRAGLTSPREDFGEAAGEEVMSLGADRGLATNEYNVYDLVVSTAAIADLVTTAIRKPTEPPWSLPEPQTLGGWPWTPSCFLVGQKLRRIALVSHWTDERHHAEARSWRTLGEICVYELPLEQVVVVLGQSRNGRRYGAWSKCFQHPQNKQIRFRKRSKGFRLPGNAFKDTWIDCWRVDHAEITNQTWLQAMLTDDVLPEVLFRVDVEVPPALQLKRIREMAKRKMDRLAKLTELPEANLSTCFWPVQCPFVSCCHNIPEREPSEKNGFVRITS
jgi:hypothetical protein